MDDRDSIPGRGREGNSISTTASTLSLEPTQTPIQWVLWALLSGVKRQGREADYSPSSSAKVKNVCGAIPPIPIHLHGVVLS